MASATARVGQQMESIRKNLLSVIRKIENATVPALIHGMQPIFDESQVLVPVKTGELKRSGFLVAERRGGGVSAAIGYAKKGNPMYAIIQHERLDFSHTAPTQAKYLEEAVNRHLDKIQPRVAAFIRKEVGLS